MTLNSDSFLRHAMLAGRPPSRREQERALAQLEAQLSPTRDAARGGQRLAVLTQGLPTGDSTGDEAGFVSPRSPPSAGPATPSHVPSPTDQAEAAEAGVRVRLGLEFRSLFLFSGSFPPRRWVYDLTHHRVFEGCVITLIFANCVFLAMDDPMVAQSDQPEYLRHMEIFFTAVFATEMCLKVFAHGFVLHPGSYLRSGWNVLDFLIVLMSFLAFLPFFGNYSAIRTLRVIRPLRSINGIRGLRNIVNGLLGSIKKLVHVLALASFLFFIFGILGVQLWQGRFTYRCQLRINVTAPGYASSYVRCPPNATDCGQSAYVEGVPVHEDEGVERFCRPSATSTSPSIWGRPCDSGYVCIDTHTNPNNGFTSFDHVGFAFLVIFQCLTMEGWVDIMYIVQDVWSTLGIFYFIMLVILGSFLILNLALAVINEEFTTINDQTKDERMQELSELYERALAVELAERAQGHMDYDDETDPGSVEVVDERGITTWHQVGPETAKRPAAGAEPRGSIDLQSTPPAGGLDAGQKKRRRLKPLPQAPTFAFSFTEGDSQPDRGRTVSNAVRQGFMKARWMCYRVVDHPVFQPMIIFFIVVNTVLLAAEHHGQPRWLTDTLDVANVVLAAIFCVEMLLKIVASGLSGYVADRFNVLDGLVVVMSVVEFAVIKQGCVTGCQGASGANVSVFRALRLLRVFKLLKNFHELRTLISVILFAVSDTGYLNLIILLYLFIAALVGMQFFGGKFDFPENDPEERIPRPNFNSFYASLLAVFQILTRDDWVVVMWNAMEVTGEWSCLYFLALVVCGDFLILNLFLAILIQSFDENVESDSDSEADGVVPPEPPPEIMSTAGGRSIMFTPHSSEYGWKACSGWLGTGRAPRSPQWRRSTQLTPCAARSACSYRDLARMSVSIQHQLTDSAPAPAPAPAARPGRPSPRQSVALCPLQPHPHAAARVPSGGPAALTGRGSFLGRTGSMARIGSTRTPPRGSTVPIAHKARARSPQHVSLPACDVHKSGSDSGADHEGRYALPAHCAQRILSVSGGSWNRGRGSRQLDSRRHTRHLAPHDAPDGPPPPDSVLPADGIPCQRCGEPTHQHDIKSHERVCDAVRLRKMREASLRALQSAIAAQRAARARPDSDAVAAVLSIAWEAGTMLDTVPEQLAAEALAVDSRPGLPASAAPQMTVQTPAGANQPARTLPRRPSRMRTTPRRDSGRSNDPDGRTSPSFRLAPQVSPAIRVSPAEAGSPAAEAEAAAVHSLRRRAVALEREITRLQELAKATKLTRLDEGRITERVSALYMDLGQMRYSLEVLDGWSRVAAAVAEHQCLLALRNGEETMGGALMAFVRGNKPPVHRTNGGYALCLFGPTNKLRVLVYRLVKHPTFDAAILACILLSSLLMAIESPRHDLDDTYKSINRVIEETNLVFTVIFVLEMCLKLTAFGILFGSSDPDPPYLRDSWNIMDGCIVVVSVLSLAFEGSNLAFLKVFRTFRALRPLRVIARNRGLRMVVSTLLQSIGSIGHVALISFLVFLVFGILGVQLLAGKMHHCSDLTILHRDACFGWHTVPCGDDAPAGPCWIHRSWENKNLQHYDNVLASLLTLFEISTLEMWTSIMYGAIDAVDVDVAPRRDENPGLGIFYMVFVTVGALFILNLFVGVVIHHYNDVKSKEDGLNFLTVEQRLWTDAQRMMLNFKPAVRMTMPRSSRLLRLYFFAQSDTFEVFIGACILLNVVVMAMEYQGQQEDFALAVEWANRAFALIFFIEACIKLISFRTSYFRDGWNRFDFFLVMLSIVSALLDSLSSTGLPIKSSLLRVMRIFRIMRILRLVRAARDVRILLETVWYSLPSIANIGGFLFLLFFIYAILGVNLFGNVRRGDSGMGLTYHANFETFPGAALLLFRMVTGENWNAVMHDAMVRPPHCGHAAYDDCGSREAAPLYFISFLLLAAFVLVNLFVAIILDNFATTMHIEKSSLRLHDLHRFLYIWSDFDPAQTLTIPTAHLPKLLERLGPPLGISRRTSRVEILKCNRQYSIPEHLGRVHFIETIIPLARQVMQKDWQSTTDAGELRDQEESWRLAFPDIHKLPVFRVRQRRAATDHYFAAAYIAAAYRRGLASCEAMRLREERYTARLLWLRDRIEQTPEPARAKLRRQALLASAKAAGVSCPRTLTSFLALPYGVGLALGEQLREIFSPNQYGQKKRTEIAAEHIGKFLEKMRGGRTAPNSPVRGAPLLGSPRGAASRNVSPDSPAAARAPGSPVLAHHCSNRSTKSARSGRSSGNQVAAAREADQGHGFDRYMEPADSHGDTETSSCISQPSVDVRLSGNEWSDTAQSPFAAR